MIQNSSSVLVGKFTRSSASPNQRYDVAHMMIITELLKLILSTIVEFSLNGGSSVLSSFSYSSLQLFPPALLYLIQNTLIYVSLAYLSVPTFQVLYQSKLIMTALLSTAFLNHTYRVRQWSGLLLLTLGVTVVTLSEGGYEGRSHQGEQLDTAWGVGLVLISCVCSSLAGIYFEALIKDVRNWCVHLPCYFCCISWRRKKSTEAPPPAASVWIRNIQLSAITLLIASAQELLLHFSSLNSSNNEERQRYRSFFRGFTPWVCLQILLLGGGGLIVAAVIKYTDNVQKGMATGVSVVISSILSRLIFGTTLPVHFTTGASLVLIGLVLFNDDLSNVFLKMRISRAILATILLIGVCSFSLYGHYLLFSKQKEDFVNFSSLENSFYSLLSVNASRNSQFLSFNQSAVKS